VGRERANKEGKMIPLVIDCSPICYKALAVMGEDFTYEDEQTGVIFSFLLQVFKFADAFATKELVFCWDSKHYKRKEIYPEYKENRTQTINPYQRKIAKKQMLELRCIILPKLGFKNSFIEKGYEADDIIAAIVRENPGVAVMASDNDLWQLLDDCTIYKLDKDNSVLTKKIFMDKYEVEPLEWIEVKNLMGCSGDNVKGIEGVGLKKAIQYLKETLPNGKIKERIKSKESRQIIIRNDNLIRLPYIGLKFDGKIKETTCSSINTWIDVFTDYGFKSFLKKDYFNRLKTIFKLK
jgi:DNA polymerase-1